MKKISITLSLTVLLLLASCTIRGLPYPTETPTPDLEATREIVEAGMFPSPTVEPTTVQPTDTPAPTATKEAVPISSGPSFQIPGQVLRLAYTVNGDLFYWEDGQAPIQLTERGDVYLAALNSDASQIAYAVAPDRGVRELFLVEIESKQSRLLMGAEDFQTLVRFPDDLTGAPMQLFWIPDTDLVVFSTEIVIDWPTPPRWHEVVSVDTVSLTQTKLADIDNGGRIHLSPDGTQIAILNPDLVSLVNVDGSNLREIFSYPHIITDSEFWYYPPLTWNADGSALRMILPPEFPMMERDKPSRVLQLNPNGTQRTLASVLMGPALFFDPLLSLDGSHLLYMGQDADENTGSGPLYHSRADGGQSAVYATGQIDPLVWSPDNRHFIYGKGFSTYLGMVGEDPILLESRGSAQAAAFVDPARYLITTESMDGWQLWLGALDGTLFLIAESESEITFDFGR